MQDARIVHLATHGLLDEMDHLGLGPPGADRPHPQRHSPIPRWVTTPPRKYLILNWPADLVVLSACNTGRGTITGDGVVGLSRALFSAGATSVVVSLWPVPDESTSTLMVEFYRQLQSDPDKAQALRRAMLATLKQHPQTPGMGRIYTDWSVGSFFSFFGNEVPSSHPRMKLRACNSSRNN